MAAKKVKKIRLLCMYRLHIHTNKIPKYVRTIAFEQYIVEEPLQQKDLEGQVARIETSEPPLSLLQELPAREGIGQGFPCLLFLG
mmetsp:Transcript_7199/g.14966  ORF Transcript_7199/g.14966 Transcript_7199/m.14966 type:complete len:85 (-) Transcript_7199:1961-2215(-)